MAFPKFDKQTTKYSAATRVYESLVNKDYEDRIGYDELSAIMIVDSRSSRGRSAVLRAGKRLLKENDKLLINVRGEGYQIAHPRDHVEVAIGLQKQSNRKLRRAAQAIVRTALMMLTPEERNRLLQEQVRVGLKLSLSKRLENAKALPTREQVKVPSGRELVRLITRKAS